MKRIIILLAVSLRLSIAHPTAIPSDLSNVPETDSDKSRKIIGQSVVTSVSVIMNGNEEPQFTDAVGKTVPRPFVPPQVASPINLLNPDRYEFYTFNEKGELVKRLMTLREIQSIVANGNGALIGGDNDPNEAQSVILNSIPLTNSNHDSDTKVQDIVDTVQNVLSREMENNKNISTIPHELLDTPNVSSSWSMILPAIFGNTGDEILPQVPINMTPEAEVIDTTTIKQTTSTRRPISKRPPATTTRKVPTTKTTLAPKKQTTKLEQKITQSTTKLPSTTKRTTVLTKKPITSSTTKKQQTVKTKPTNSAFRSTTRRPIVSIINNIPSIKDDVDETTKTVLITSRPYSTTTKLSTSSESTTRSPVTRTTTRKIIKKPTASNVRKNSTTQSILHKVPASSLIKDSQITKIEMKPAMVELKNESNFEKTTHEPSTILSTLSIISSTTQRPTMMEVVKIETFAPPTKVFTKAPSTILTTQTTTTEYEAPSSSSTIKFSSSRPIMTEKEKFTTMSLIPIKLETFTTTEQPKIPETTVMEMINEETTSVELPSSEEIRQDLAISQIIGSLQNNDFNMNHLFKPFNNDMKESSSTTMASPQVDERTTTMQIVEQESDNINHVPDNVFVNNQLYLDEKESIVKDILTTEAPVIDEMATIENEQTSEKITTTVNSKEDSISLLENNEVMETIEKLLLEQNKSKNKVSAEKLDILGFDDDDETEIQLENNFNKKTTKTTKAPLVFTKITQRSTEMPPTTTTVMANEESETTISTILSEALSNVIEQMIKEQEFRKTSTASAELPETTTKPIIKVSTVSTTKAPIVKSSTTVTELPQTTSKTTPEAIEPSLDELNKLLYHYQDLSSIRNELESLSLVKEDMVTTTETPMSEDLETSTFETVKKVHPIIEEKSSSSLHHDKIYSEIDSTTVSSILEEETTMTEDPTTQEFTTFFYVSDSSVEETTDDNLGEFTTEQFVTSEKRISERKNEAFTTTFPPLTDSDEDNDTEEEEEETPADLVSNVFDAIGLSSNSEEDGEEENASTEKNLQINNVNDAPTTESEESDEIVSTISKISSTLDKTLQTDINTDFTLTSKIANSLISVADSISDTLNDDTESDEITDTLLRTTVIPKEQPESTSTQKVITETENHEEEMNLPERKNEHLIEISSEAFQSTTIEFQEEMTTEKFDEAPTTLESILSEEDLTTTTVYKVPNVTKKLPKFPLKNNNKHKVNDSSPMVQLSIIRKEDSLEEINIMTPAIPTSTKIPITEGNFIKIESIDMSTKKMKTTTSSPNINETKNITHENVKPISLAQRATTAKSSSLPDIVPSQATKLLIEKHESGDEKTDEPLTERVPLIEKVPKEMTSAPIMMASDENLVQIQVQTKPPTTIHSSSAKTPIEFKTTVSTAANVQSIKNSIKNAQQFQVHTRPIIQTIDLSSSPKENLGLAASTANLNSDLSDFSKLCNELAFTFWKSITADGISQSRSVVISPFALTSTLSMIFLGARGQTSGEMNDLLRLDDTVTFNPHVVFRNISESVEQSRNSGIAAAAFARELYSDRTKGKLLPYFKEKAQQFYGAHVEEVNFNVVNDILRRRTNLLVKKHTYNKIKEYLKTNNIWVNEPLAAVSANIFMTDCSGSLFNERDGEMFFQVSPAIRQRRLVPIPAAVFRRGFTAGYDPILDATAVAFGDDLQSTILVMPGQQGSLSPGDNLERLENAFLDSSNDVWGRLLTTFMDRPGLEVQIPRFSHRSLINTTYALQQMGLKDMFDSEKADLRGITGLSSTDLYFSDMMQINQFTTCGEDKIGDSHHIEIYPSPALKREFANEAEEARYEMASVDGTMQYKSLFYDPIYDSRYMNVPLPLRPRQARLPENPRLRFDRPFLYFVRHNPTGIILFMGRFNPRLLP
ncbi:hypothetical protein ACKWTF_005584 [Chironomus riparius]